jgi:hypothetical protein
MDKLNDRYGEFTVIHALMVGMKDTILDRVAFGGIKDPLIRKRSATLQV